MSPHPDKKLASRTGSDEEKKEDARSKLSDQRKKK